MNKPRERTRAELAADLAEMISRHDELSVSHKRLETNTDLVEQRVARLVRQMADYKSALEAGLAMLEEQTPDITWIGGAQYAMGKHGPEPVNTEPTIEVKLLRHLAGLLP